MTKLTRIILSNDSVSETEANTVFNLLVPIIEGDPSAEDAVEAARHVISRFALSEDRLLAHLLDWWFVVTTGKRTANDGAYNLPNTLDNRVKGCMDAVARLNVSLPAAEWLHKRSELNVRKNELDNIGGLELNGLMTLGADLDLASLVRDKLGGIAKQLRQNRKAEETDVAWDRELRDKSIEPNSKRYKDLRKRCTRETENINRVVRLQHEVEPWIPRYVPDLITEVPSQLQDAVGPLAVALLRPILTSHVAPIVDRAEVVERINSAINNKDRRGRYRLARIISNWCEETGQTVGLISEELRRHGELRDALTKLKANPQVSDDEVDEIRVYVLDDDLEAAEKAHELLIEKFKRTQRAELARNQFEGLRRELRQSIFAEDESWHAKLEELENRLESDNPYEIAPAISAAHTELSHEISKLLQDQLRDLESRLVELDALVEGDPPIRKQFWEKKIEAAEQNSGRGTIELKQEFDSELEQLRQEYRERTTTGLEQISKILNDERGDFSSEDIGSFENRRTEIEVLLKDENLADEKLALTSKKADQLWSDIGNQRIHRWRSEDGEEELLKHLLAHCSGALQFDEMDIRRLYVSLKTRPFVILAGLTGSGKSSLSRTFAEALGATSTNGRFRRVAVRPDWIDQTEVVGFVNPVSESFVPGWLAETVRDCEREPDQLHFVLLDEMNLAPVEQYLAEWLSAIEEWRSGSNHVRIPLYSGSLNPKNHEDWPPSLKFPDNLFIIGTVNVDETTRPLSERVLDRANVLLLSVAVSESHHHPNGQQAPPWLVGAKEWRKACTNEPSDKHHDFLIEIADILRQVRIGVGLRAHLELERFVANAQGIIEDVPALDWGLVQRIIPKIRGFKGYLQQSLNDLHNEFEGVGAKQAASILDYWLDDKFVDDEYLDGTDPRITFARR